MLHLILGAALGLHLTPCSVAKPKIAAKCGTFGVYENRETRRGRIIELRVLVVPAKHPSGKALTWLEGGPGGSAVNTAPYILSGLVEKEFVAQRDRYDEFFVDSRGTGESHPFLCNFAPPNEPAAYFAHLWDSGLMRRCIARTRGYADPNQYNTNNAVDDLDDVRAALGYNKVVLDGGSYGTFAALVYIRRHEAHVAAAILDGVDAPGFQALPGAPDGAQVALDDLIVKCRRDAICRRLYPDFGNQFAELLDRLQRPIAMTVENRDTKRTYDVRLSKEVFVDQFRHLLYSADSAAFGPLIVDQAISKDYAPLARVVQLISEGFGTDTNDGALLSYSCSEELPFISEAQIAKAARASFAGDLRIRAQQRACKAWNVRAMPASFNEPVRSNVPIVMLTGSDDPATPPESAAQALRYLPNAKEVIVQGAGHGAETPCTDTLVETFLDTLSTKGLDTTHCSVREKTLPFATSVKQLP